MRNINKHLRPISLTPIISKIAESFVVETFVKPAVLKRLDRNQYGTIPNSNTVYALISMIHEWNGSTDGNGGTTRVILFDFRKAFDLIDHHILVQKLKTYDLPSWTIDWIRDFYHLQKTTSQTKSGLLLGMGIGYSGRSLRHAVRPMVIHYNDERY